MKRTIATALAIATAAIGAIAPQAQAQQESFITTSSREVATACLTWTDTDAAFDACLEENKESGVEVVFTQRPGDGDYGRNTYLTSWRFCELNQELDSELASNVCEF